jgi:dihydrofolate reductase
MRKIIALAMISLDGVIQAPGGPQEDTSGGFKYGGWSAPYNDEVLGKLVQKFMQPADLLLGRKTYEIFAGYWPDHADYWPGITDVTKYVLSATLTPSDALVKGWKNSVVLRSMSDIENLKSGKLPGSAGGDIKMWGSSELVPALLAHDLVDELWLQIHPIILGKGKKLFNDSVIPAAWTLTESTATPSGVIVACYKRAGEVKTGTAGA